MQSFEKQLVIDFNNGLSIHQIANKYGIQYYLVKGLLEASGEKLRRLQYMSDEEIQNHLENMKLDDFANYVYITPLTLKKMLRERNIKIPKHKTKDELYIEKQVLYLAFKQNMAKAQIAKSLQIELGRVTRILKESGSEYQKNRGFSDDYKLSSIGESGGMFIDYNDLANVFPKQRKYARAY